MLIQSLATEAVVIGIFVILAPVCVNYFSIAEAIVSG
jgi:hypothetical protein